MEGLSEETLAVTLQVDHEEVTIDPNYCAPHRTAIPVQDFLTLLNRSNPVYIIGDLIIKSPLLGDNSENKFGKQ